MQTLEDREDGWKGVGLVKLAVDRALVQQGYTEVEIRQWGSGEGFYEDVDDDVWIIEVRVELVAAK